jgi:branched-chain amino acid transport system substrate-binding protein
MGTGRKATGDPIALGAIVTRQPGIDFSDIAGMAQAYFECVNDNGGINGHPIRYIVETDQSNPQQVAALAARLIDDYKVLAIVGSTSLLDCTVNHQLYEQRGYNVIVAGVPYDCFTTPNISAVNMGPYYSNLGAAQYLVRQGVTSLVVAGSNIPSGEHDISGVAAYAKEKNIPSKGAFLENVPITDGAAIAQKLVQAAGDGGGVVLSFTPPEGLKILQAAEQLGLVNKVKWSWNTPGNDASVVQALGPAWNGKLGVNAELNLVDSTGPDNTLYQEVTKQYAPMIPLGSFGQMGFVAAEIVTRTLLALPADQLTPRTVNAAIRQIKDFKTDILCKPWYFGDLQYHVPDNADRTVVPENHVFTQKEGCFDIAPLAGNDLDAIRQAEKREGLIGA